jgi:hypothetical protein
MMLAKFFRQSEQIFVEDQCRNFKQIKLGILAVLSEILPKLNSTRKFIKKALKLHRKHQLQHFPLRKSPHKQTFEFSINSFVM